MTDKKNDFVLFVLEQLDGIPDVVAKQMFGGYGLYAGAVFFAIITDGRLYFKTDASTKLDYEAQGMQPFKPTEKQTLKNYFELPVSVLENSAELRHWAEKSIKVVRE